MRARVKDDDRAWFRPFKGRVVAVDIYVLLSVIIVSERFAGKPERGKDLVMV